jgi:hypothetical protein
VSAFGGVIICNREIDLETAKEIHSLFCEVLIAPNYCAEAISLLSEMKNRILLIQKPTTLPNKLFKTLLNGVIEQDKDLSMEGIADMRLVTNTNPTEQEYIDVKDITPIEPYENPNDQDTASFATSHGGDYIKLINKQIMLDSWFTIVSEASFGDSEGTCFISEKTFKPIACYHPFIIFGNQGSLEHLRKMGYKTFSPYINETYDTLPTWERLEAIITEVTRINALSFEDKLNWYAGMKDILEHNYNTLRRNSSEQVPIAIQTVKDYVNENNNC